jgi:uncharacterized protein (DUF1330 family)
MGCVEPSPEQLRSFVEAEGDDAPVVMINLLRYRERAHYPPGFDAEPCSGREAYQRYGVLVAPHIASAGARMLWLGSVQASVIAPAEERWDDAILVEYPSRKAFLQMVTNPEYLAVAGHRTAALDDSRLIATTTASSLLGADGD